MTKEQKAKAYDKAIEIAKDMINRLEKGENILLKADLKLMFPQLKESEDERIRKAIIDFFGEPGRKEYILNGFNVDDIVAWLEKQVPINEEKVLIGARKDVALSIMNFLDRNTLGMDLSSMECADLESAVIDSDWSKVYNYMKKKLEKKGGQKPNYCHHEVDLSDCSEEYRKAYYDGWNNCNMQHSQCLSEGNDVVKCLINGMKFYYEENEEATWGTEKFSMKVKDILAWLEKQGEQPKKVPIWKHWKNGTAGNGEDGLIYLIKYGYTYSLSSCLHFECDYIELSELDKLLSEKQDEQKVSYTTLVETGNGSINALVTKELPTNGCNEQKPFDYEYANIPQNDFAYIKPKFHEGDFIKHNKANIICKVISVNSGSYYVENVGTSGRIELFNAEQNFHLWTIQDAKDGDVLVHNGCTFIFMGIKDGIVQAIEEIMHALVPFGEPDKDNDYYPATKEQRDTLMKTMKDAGYVWDTEKKELRKIEQKHTEKVEPKFKAGDWVVNNYGDVWHIDSFDKKNYQISDEKGNYNYFPIAEQDEMHLWTIEDAKDGDVLACNINKAEIGGDIEKLPNITPTICIYQNVVRDKDYIHTRCSLYNGSSLIPSNSMYYNTFVYDIHPATKEQRDLLFQKIKEAGCRWNAEKKELIREYNIR